MKLAVLVFFAMFMAGMESSKILILYPTMSISHMLPLQTLAVVLAEKGHEVTFVSPFPLKKPVKNYRDVKVSYNETLKAEMMERTMGGASFLSNMKHFPEAMKLMRDVAVDVLHLEEMKRMKKEEKFDLLILGYLFDEFLLGLANHFDCPSVLFTPAGPFGIFHQALGNPYAVDGAPHILVSSKEASFKGRFITFLATGVEILVFQIIKHYNRKVYE